MMSMLLVLHPNPSLRLIRAVNEHDAPEYVLGDAPSPAFRKYPSYGYVYNQVNELIMQELGVEHDSLTEEEKNWLECLDKLEPFLFAVDQLRLGNKNMYDVIKNVDQWFVVRELDGDVPREIQAIFNQIREIDDLRQR